MRNSNYKLIAALLAGSVLTFSCTKVDRSDDFPKGDPPPVPGGYTNSSQVAETNLLAYWSFDNNNNETKSNTAGTAVNATSVAGVKGNALQLNAGYVLYPTIAALSSANALASVTVSMWVKTANNGSQASLFFCLTQPPAAQTDWLAILNVGAETGHTATDQNIAFHSWIGSYPGGVRKGGDNINDYGVAGTDFQTVAAANQWVQYIMRYDASGENIDLFVNNIRVSNNNFRTRTGFGPIISPVPTQVLLGGFPNASTGFNLSATQSWQAQLTGSIDELRVYGKALTDGEISALFQLEKQGR